jgi:hypothetical protein
LAEWLAFVALLASGLLVWFLRTDGSRRAVVSHVRSPSPTSMPVVPAGNVPDATLPVLSNRPRGAVRFTGAAATAAVRLQAILDLDQRPGVVTFEPGFVGSGFVEFYGLDAGRRWLYLEVADQSSEPLLVDIVAQRIVRLEMPALKPRTSRRLVVEGAGADAATLLLEFDGAELMQQWRGAPLQLRSPLAYPRRVTVSLAPDTSGTNRMGGVHVADAGPGELRVRVQAGDRTVRLMAEDGPPSTAPYAIELSAGKLVTADAVLPTTKNVLAILRPQEFAVPPKVHTWSTSPLGQAVSITGISDGEAWIGVGIERLARHVLWRRQLDAPQIVSRGAPSHLASFPGNSSLLPMWIRTLGRNDILAAGSRNEHDYGPGQIWEHVESTATTWRRLANWVDGNGVRLPVRASTVALPLPADMRDGDRLSLAIRKANALRGDGVLFVLEHTVGEPCNLPPLPDGLVDGALRRKGQLVASLHSVIFDGTFLGRTSAWSDSDVVADDWRDLELRATDAGGRAIAGAEVFAESPDAITKTDAEGRCRIQRAAPARRPTLVSMRLGEQFTTNAFTSEGKFEFIQREAIGDPLDWATLQSLLGVDVEGLGIGTVQLNRPPLGGTMAMRRGSRAVLAPTESIEFHAAGGGVDLWGWFDGAGVATASRASPPKLATLVLVNYGARRVVHVSLARTEIRVVLDKGRMRSLTVNAPARVSLTALVTSGPDSDMMLVDEGIAAELMADDVLVSTYPGK